MKSSPVKGPILKWLAAFILVCSSAGIFAAQEAKPLLRGSYQKIITAHTGKPFIVALWSISCTHCGADLQIFERLLKQYPSFSLVLISTDTPAVDSEIAHRLRPYQLDKSAQKKFVNLESWVFADSYTERLRFEVDAQWYGELPRTYLFDATGKSTAISGVLNAEATEKWLRSQL